jgi:UDP-glucose 4-epimerase
MTIAPVIAVTGASGSLGRVLISRLLDDPGVETIIALDRKPLPFAAERVEFRDCDVRDPEIEHHFRGCAAVVHLAFIVERGARDLTRVDQVNVGGTRNVAYAAARAGVRQIVQASSVAAYGFHPENHNTLLAEYAPIRGNDDFYYARTKAECERLLDEFERDHPDIAVARLRPSVFLGPRGARGLAQFRGWWFPYPGGNDLPVQLTHEDDVAEAFYLALKSRAHGAFNIATDEPVPVSQWPRQMGKLGMPLPINTTLRLADLAYRANLLDVDPVWLRAGAQHPLVVSSRKARRQLRWRPRYNTTGQVLRAFSGKPTTLALPSLRVMLGGGALLTRLGGSIPLRGPGSEEMHGMSGVINLVCTGKRPSEWHLELGDRAVAIRAGLGAQPRATVTVADTDFTAMLAGEPSLANALLTGKVRVQGDAAFSMIVGALVAAFGRARHSKLPGARTATDLLLRADGYLTRGPRRDQGVTP